MGNSGSVDVNPTQNDSRKELDISQHLSHGELCQHLEGNCSSRCIAVIPCHVLDSTWMYERLLASCNCLTTVPPELPLRLPHLTHIDLNYNHLATLPNSFGLFVHLSTLLLSNNAIERLPSSFVQLPRLQKLDLSYNRLLELPVDLGNMPCLAKLNVSHNKLSEIPKSLGRSKSLKVVLAQDNCCYCPPQDLCDHGTSDEIIAYLRDLQNEPDSRAGNNCIWFSSTGNTFPRVRTNDATSLSINPHSPKARYVKRQTQTTHTASRIKSPLLPPSRSTSFSLNKLGDKLIGLLYGAVIGDALGLGTEFMSPNECQFHYDYDDLTYRNIIQDEHTSHWKRGEWTSNSDQMFLVLDSVLHWAGMVDELDFAQRLLQWKNHGFPELNENEEYMLSETINEVLKTENYEKDPHLAASKLLLKSSTNGHSYTTEKLQNNRWHYADSIFCCDNGALPRALILGTIHFHNLKEVVTNSIRICLATHADERCIATCVALSVLVALLLQGKYDIQHEKEMGALLNFARETAQQHLTLDENKKEFDKCFEATDYPSLKLSEKGKAHFTYKPLAAAIMALKSQKDFRTAMADTILQGGHGSMNGCVAGAVLGCATGFASLPKDWVEGLLPRNVDFLNGRINNLLDKMGLP